MEGATKKILYYSLDEMMTSAKLKALKTISLDQEKAGKLQDWMQKYQIK